MSSALPGQPGAPLVDPGPGACAGPDHLRRWIDRLQVGQEGVEVEIKVRQKVDLVHDDHLGGPEHHGVLEGFSSPSVMA